jgi:DNA-binding PucR family transcriptional regulator
VATGLGALHEAARQARIALRGARNRGEGESHAAWTTLGADRLVAQLPDSALADAPAALVEFLRGQAVLAQTLAAFLEAAGDVQATAAELSLHRSGLYYRLRRVEELTGLNLDSGDDRLLAHLALRLLAGTERSS